MDAERTNEFVSVSRGFFGMNGEKRFKKSITIPLNDDVINFVSEKIKSEIRKATAITSAFGSTLVLGETTFDLMNGKIRINGVNLNSDDTTISNLVFTNLVTGVKYSYTVSSNFGQSRKEYQSSIDIEGGAEMRSN